VPLYDWYQVTLAFYSFFRSNRESVLFHPLGRRGDWIPFECAGIAALGFAFALAGAALAALGRPFPRRLAIAAAAACGSPSTARIR
jgi:hypothetical protein